ncbi:class I SAM-dependent methyltransferase [Acidiferrimicrobium sp. IK]|uniref:class I SAM-dependent methyltransferase n=1 Tax=Acidiferrimicrobium sp. IK TaxID=2871700 RepID=UPI0021CB96C9|nr:class I SAM-dependent methyltransferase [Acidiferrimicrobium sp. IK]MCU4186029.1 class I SAM-dependent methyltransferase [Acidiferrimicrobium sp. IK]
MNIASALEKVLGGTTPLAFSACDGSSAGHPDPVGRIIIRDRRALNYMVTAPGELGLARAYVSGYLDLEGDLHDTMVLLARDTVGGLTWAERLEVLRSFGVGVLRPVQPPPEEVRPGLWWGLRHSLDRDSRVISHHYDVSNTFYEWILGPTMAYTCAVYPTSEATLEEAQIEKVDLVCRKLGLQPGQRLLDVGCGWGTMVRHAAAEYGVNVLGVTLSRQQAEWGQKLIADQGLSDRAEIRHADYRSVTESEFDAISSIGLTEHIGLANLPAYASFLASKLKARGRLLNHCITRPDVTGDGVRSKGFINRYVFPDGELEGVGTIISALQNAGLEVRHEENLREHYARTCAAWAANLDAHWTEAVAEVGEGKARVWRLYLTGSRLGFEQRRIELHQVLAVKTEDGQAAMPLRPDFRRRVAAG